MRIPFVGSLVAASLAVLTACAEPAAPFDNTGSARLTVLLTDAPGDILEAVVTIDQIYLQGSEDESGGRVVILDDPVTVNLLDLVNETLTLTDGVEIAPGTYAQLRFVISGGYIVVEGDEPGSVLLYASSPSYAGLPEDAEVDGALVMPSFAESGLKVSFPGALLLAPGATTLMVDFSVVDSFGKQAGQSGNWVMTPVLTGETVSAPAP